MAGRVAGRLSRAALLVGLLSAAWPAAASPNLPVDDPVHLILARLRALGRLPADPGGATAMLAETDAQRLLAAAGAAPLPRLLAADVTGWWARPVAHTRSRLAVASDEARPYATAVLGRNLLGAVSTSCELVEGRPCGDGAHLALELDSAAGHGTWLALALRTRVAFGSAPAGSDVELDRAYLRLDLGPALVQLGRDVVALGPAARNAVLWGRHPAPLDHVRVATARPLGNTTLRVHALYLLGRLRDPQRFQGSLVQVGRLRLELLEVLALGASHLVQLGGEGAPAIDVWDLLLENFRRKHAEPLGISNHRIALDVSLVLRPLRGARVYYEVAFEDTRDQFLDAYRFDADHVLGVELPALDDEGRHGLTVEVLTTGFRSHEHGLFTTGLTHAGRLPGAPLGPDAWSLFVEGRLDLGRAQLWPSAELARLASDQWAEDATGIRRVAEGEKETRLRLGLRLATDGPTWRGELSAFLEHVRGEAFEPARRRTGGGALLTVTWSPGVTYGGR